jgi:hypothetical protein
MPEEFSLLKDQPLPDKLYCQYCGFPIEDPFMPRGTIQSWWRKLLKLPYCAIVCEHCKSIGAWEKP